MAAFKDISIDKAAVGDDGGSVLGFNSNPPNLPSLNYVGGGGIVTSGSVIDSVVSTWIFIATPDAGRTFLGWNYVGLTGVGAQPLLANPVSIPNQGEGTPILYPVFAKPNIIPLPPYLSTTINHAIQVADCCAVKKGHEYIKGLADGKSCEDLLNEAQEMVSLTNALRGFIPEGEPIRGTQASGWINPTTTTIGSVLSLNLNYSDALMSDTISSYTFTATSNSNQEFTSLIASVINAKHASDPVAYPFTAVSTADNGGTVYIYGSYYDVDNNEYLRFSVVSGSLFWNTSNYMLNGVVTATQPENCITTEEAQKILNKLCNVCSLPCDSVANFLN